jgi:AcrR family transcriptional regulator
VRQSHLTYYFPKRHDLVEAAAARFIDGMIRGVVDVAARSAAEDPGAMLQHIAAAITDRGHMRMFTGIIVEADGDPALRAMVVRLTLRLQSTLAELLGGEDALDRARLILASLLGLGLYDFVVRPEHGSALPSSFLASLTGAAPGHTPSGTS